MKSKKTSQRTRKQDPSKVVRRYMKHLTFDELEQVIAWAERYRKEKLGAEELQLIREKEKLEQKIKELKDMDKIINDY